MTPITKLLLIFGGIMVTLAFMIFGPHGSLDPSEIGFYTSIGAGILWYSATYFIFKKVFDGKADNDTNQ